MRLTASIVQLRQQDGQLAVADRRCGPVDVERTGQTYGAGEAAELALDEVKRLVGARRARCFFAGDDQYAGAEQDADGRRRDAADVDDHLNGLIGFEHVERRMALTGVGAVLVPQARRELIEQLADVLGELLRLARREERELSQWSMVPEILESQIANPESQI